MTHKIAKLGLALIILVGASACDSVSDRGIGKLFSSNSVSQGPDEFSIIPTKPLEMPTDFAALPEPSTSGRNRVDLQPEHDAITALGGNPDRLNSTSVGAGEGALLAAATRFGTGENIREVVAAEDAAFRKKTRPRFFERLFKTNSYYRRYEPQTLKARAANETHRRRGARTPSVAPPNAE